MKFMLCFLIMSVLIIYINVIRLIFFFGILEIYRRCMYLSFIYMDVFVDMVSCLDNKFYFCFFII